MKRTGFPDCVYFTYSASCQKLVVILQTVTNCPFARQGYRPLSLWERVRVRAVWSGECPHPSPCMHVPSRGRGDDITKVENDQFMTRHNMCPQPLANIARSTKALSLQHLRRYDFFNFHDNEHQRAACDDDEPVCQREPCASEHPVHRFQVGVGKLDQYQKPRADEDDSVAEKCFEKALTENRVVHPAAVEKVEELAEHDHVHRGCL